MYLWWMPIPFLRGAEFTVGASAPIFGLLGAIVYYGRRTGSSHAVADGSAVRAGDGRLRPHLAGRRQLRARRAASPAAISPGLILDPLKPERVDHMVIALACLVATLIAIVASVITALPLLLAELTDRFNRTVASSTVRIVPPDD